MATSSLGRLTLDMVVKLGNYMEGLDKAGRQAKKSGKEIESGLNVGSLAIKALGAAVAGITIGGISAFANETIEAGNEIKKFSQLANTSIRDFQYYSKGAATAGINIESFADKMKDMQDRIGDFQQTGGGPLADFFENIAPLVGVTIQQFQKLSGPEALQLYYDSLVKVGASQNDVKFYMEAIISDSSLLLPLLENNGAGFKKWGDEAQRTGAILSDDMVNSLASAKEHLQMMDLQWQGLQANLINSVVPVLEVVTDNIDDIKAVGVAVAVGMSAKFIPVIIASTIQLGQLAVFSVRAGAGLLSLSSGAGVAASTMTVLRGALAFLGGPAGIGMLAIQGIAAGSAFLYMKKSSNEVDGALSKQGKSVAELITEYNNLSEAQQRAFKYQETVELKELGEKYNQTRQQVRAYASSIAEVVAKNEATKNTIRGWIKDFDNQRISAEDLANKINKLSDVGSENKQNMDKHAVAATNAKNSMIAQQKVVESLATHTVNLTKKSDALTVSTNNQAKAWLTLTQKQRAALTGIQDQNARSQYIANNMALGWSRDKAEYVADYRDKAGLDYSKRLTKYELIQLENGFKIQQQAKAKEESEKKIEEAKKRQLDYIEKNYTYSKAEVAMLERVAKLSAQYNLDGIGAKEGVPKGMLAALMAQESKGDIYAKSPTGAMGPFQTTSIYRKQHGLSVADSYDVKKSAEAAAKDLAASFEIFGNWSDAITAYNAGVQGTKDLKNKGFTGSTAKTKEAKQYAGLVDKWLVGFGGSSSKSSGVLANDAAADLKDWSDYWGDLEEMRKQALESQQVVQQTYFTEDQRMAEDHKEKIKAIELAYAGDDVAIKKYTELENAAYKKSVDEYKESLTQKSLDEKKQLLEVRKNWLTAGDYAEQYYALVREEILNTSEYSPEMKDALIKQANSQQGIDQNADRENVWADYQSRMGLDESPYQHDMNLLKAARDQMLITEEEYQRQRLEMQLSYGAQYGADFAGMMMGLVDSSSSAYAVLGTAQKAFALYSVMMDSKVAISKAWASAAFPYNMPAVGMAVMQTGLLQAAVQALSPVGMAHNGIDNIPKEGTWLLDGGERVLNPQQNKDLTNYLAEKQASQTQQTAPQLNQSIVNVVNWDEVPGVMAGPAGQKTTLNTISKNKTQIRKLLGIA
ncbi:hypothetical protein D9K80_15660 [Acinetobacter cumulans]|uniref:Transglycosylase SLT domain-containing protein n=1 Tax=Acinetobacter cumulans TaxID=2136182 RepID=A0A498D7N7_9GAMM|nr:transglycosylase SLT domain-containing protein [Acinetobacter cumulans]RLL30741.1 hypothetical protein D9K80_15660 [Acinetobacter cumulans]